MTTEWKRTRFNWAGEAGLEGWVDYDGCTADGFHIPVKLTLNWINVASEVAFKYIGTKGLCLHESIEAKLADVPEAMVWLDSDAHLEYKTESTVEAWGDERNRKIGSDVLIHCHSLELDELLGMAEYLVELWEMYGAADHLLTVDEGYDTYADGIRENRMLYHSRLRCLKTAVKKLRKLANRKETAYYDRIAARAKARIAREA